MGLDPIRSGEVRVATLAGWQPPDVRWRQGVGLVSEDRKEEGLALDLSIAENITLPRLRGPGAVAWFVTPGGQDRASRPLIEQLAIKCRSPRQPVSALSGGNQQKVALARLLHADCDLLLLDEPTRGIDVGSKAQIYRLDRPARRGRSRRRAAAAGGAGGEQLPAGAVGHLRPHRRDVPRPAGRVPAGGGAGRTSHHARRDRRGVSG